MSIFLYAFLQFAKFIIPYLLTFYGGESLATAFESGGTLIHAFCRAYVENYGRELVAIHAARGGHLFRNDGKKRDISMDIIIFGGKSNSKGCIALTFCCINFIYNFLYLNRPIRVFIIKFSVCDVFAKILNLL